MTLTANTLPTLQELESYKMIAQVTAGNELWRKKGGRGNEESIVATLFSIILFGRELGVSPIISINEINNVNGKYEISARLMNNLIRQRGHKLEIKKSTNEVCIIYGKRKDTGEEHTEMYHIEDAARAGLIRSGSAWEKVPKDMLFARCISRLARRVYADCIGSAYVEFELSETIEGKITKPEDIQAISSAKKEIDVTPEIPVQFVFPPHLDHEEAMTFLKECVANSNTSTLESAMQKALNDMDSFTIAFDKWKAKNNPIEELKKEEEHVLEEKAYA